MKDMKRRMCQEYPFMRKNGSVYDSFEKEKVFQKHRNEKLLVLIIGVQGSGKTTYCEKNFSDYTVINIDVIAQNLLKNDINVDQLSPLDINEKVNEIFFENIEKELQKGIAIVESGAVQLPVRRFMLDYLLDKYTKVILLVLNPEKEKIINQIKAEPEKRLLTSDLWKEVDQEFNFLQIQIKEHYLEMGVDEVYYV